MLDKKNKNPKNKTIKCQLEDNKICDNCCNCYICDLNPTKICDNCAKCLDLPDFSAIIIDDILLFDEKPKKKIKKNNF